MPIASVELLGTRIHLADAGQALRAALGLFSTDQPHQIVTANALLLLEAERSPSLRRACREASLVISDSAGISFAAAVRGIPKPPRLPGIDFAHALIGEAARAGHSVYLLGGAPGVAERAAARLARTFPALRLAGCHSGYFSAADDQRVAELIRNAGARLVLVALGMPKQDIWIHNNIGRLGPAVCIGVGGAFDVWCGAVPRAPRAFQRLGVEWMYRLWRQPSRWRRMKRLPLFALRAVFAKSS